MPPLQDLGAEGFGHEEPSLGAGAGTGLILEGSLYLSLYVPGERRHDPGLWQDGGWTLETVAILLELTGEGVRLEITGTWAKRQRKIEA